MITSSSNLLSGGNEVSTFESTTATSSVSQGSSSRRSSKIPTPSSAAFVTINDDSKAFVRTRDGSYTRFACGFGGNILNYCHVIPKNQLQMVSSCKLLSFNIQDMYDSNMGCLLVVPFIQSTRHVPTFTHTPITSRQYCHLMR